MKSSYVFPALRRCALALALTAAAGLASAQSMHVVLDTSGWGSSSGWLDLQFNPASVPAVAASALVDHLSGFDGTSAPQLNGDVQAQAGGFRFANSTDWNDLFHAVHLGGKLSFDVSFNGLPDPSPAAIPSLFSVSLYGADGVSQLGHPDADGSLLSLSWNPAAGGAGQVGVSVVDAGVASVSPVPEPSAWLMLGAGLALLGVAKRRRA
ncbi:NF038129 family PEP-CTERM protein [Rugamonas apoptosis]|uniref:NF038129 family PEP-CTERM protein n=1 Tax=Rugamonas apoptosis TaxID=2758570 RepID=A0A7W2FEE8_9BURK|nr:NF038129 family PEP-CTERM protein [Rugamonas apoptosis]MBA5690102.1 NF038129 family PEP-CTERM protein [Rugamonas apoptosis]